MTKRTTYTKEFKLEAIRLLEAGDKPGTQIARELGIRRNMLYKWQDQLSNKQRCEGQVLRFALNAQNKT